MARQARCVADREIKSRAPFTAIGDHLFPIMQYNAVCILDRCVSSAGIDARAATRPSTDLARSYADRAMACLRTAVDRGYNHVDTLRTDKGLDPLRQRDDFKQLLDSLKQG